MSSISITGDGIIYPDNIQGVQQSPYPTIGTVLMWAGGWGVSTSPNGWLICDGTAYNKTTYADLYAMIGDTYGATASTFQVPDLVQKVPIGADDMTISSSYTVDSKLTGGTNTISSDFFRHNHTLNDYNLMWDNDTNASNFEKDSGDELRQTDVVSDISTVASSYQYSVDGTEHSGTQEKYYPPYTVIRYIICSGVI